MGFCKWIDSQSLLIKLIIFFPVWGGIFGFLYRLFKFIEKKNALTLVFGILCIAGPICWVMGVIDFVFVILNGKPTLFAD